jgi:hypothetical protein
VREISKLEEQGAYTLDSLFAWFEQ